MYLKINTVFPHVLSGVCDSLHIKLIHPTTDCVYTGLKGSYTEKDIPDENGMYGMSKRLGEPENCCVIRTSIIGEEINHKYSLLGKKRCMCVCILLGTYDIISYHQI